MAGKQDRKFCGVLYPDAENYNAKEVLAKLGTAFESWTFVLHDMDVTEDGEVKKAHYHWVGKLDNPTTPSSIANKLGIPENDVCFCKSWKAQVRYQIHADDPEKFQYPVEAVTANFNFLAFVRKGEEVGRAASLFAVICERNIKSTKELTQWALENDCWSELRRGYAIWAAIMNENQRS